jgi:hypothetical protein
VLDAIMAEWDAGGAMPITEVVVATARPAGCHGPLL